MERNHGPLSKELCKQGCPPGIRAVLWHQVLGIEITDKVGFDAFFCIRCQAYVGPPSKFDL